jgi:hypothetical protein
MKTGKIAGLFVALIVLFGGCKKSSKSDPVSSVYYTTNYVGTYVSTNFDCGQGAGSQTTIVSVDPGNKDRLIIGSMYADMTDHTHFNIPSQTVAGATVTGSGTIDGTNMHWTYTTTISAGGQTYNTTCTGDFTKQSTNTTPYYTTAYAGNYQSTNFNCGQGNMTQTIVVSVDPANKDRLHIGAMYADMTDHTHFNIPNQNVGGSTINGSGTIDGTNMSLTYTGTLSVAGQTYNTTCSGDCTRQK